MSDMFAVLYGQCEPWPDQPALVRCFSQAGMRITRGRHSVRVDDCTHFVFQHLGGGPTEPCIEADAPDACSLLADAQRVSAALAVAGVRHRFELFDADEQPAGYLHHEWPCDEGQR